MALINTVKHNQIGTLVLSLDFELLWGIRDFAESNLHQHAIINTRCVVPALLELFHKYDVHATWAVVGFLLFDDRAELLANLPKVRPFYKNKYLSPYEDLPSIGENETEDGLHFAASLVRQITATPYQELGTHTFSHYYCLENGQIPDDFRGDLCAAQKVAAKFNSKIVSIVFPRNQCSFPHLQVCAEHGVLAYRGNETEWYYHEQEHRVYRQWHRRLFRLMDAYVNLSGDNTYLIPDDNVLPMNLPSSRYLRSFTKKLRFLEPLRLQRILTSMTSAARNGQIFHLWWHPEDFSGNFKENLIFLKKLLIHFKKLQHLYGMRSLNMGEIAEDVLRNAKDSK